jgi:chromate transporter
MSWGELWLVFLRAAFFSMNGSTTLALLQQDLVERLHVLSPAQFATGVVIGCASPGPLGYGCIALGFLADGWRGALVATFTSWLPAFLAIPLRAGYRRLEGRKWISGLTWGVAAAGGGLLLALAGSLTMETLRFDPRAGTLKGWPETLLGGLVLLLLVRRLPIILVLVMAALLGALFLR